MADSTSHAGMCNMLSDVACMDSIRRILSGSHKHIYSINFNKPVGNSRADSTSHAGMCNMLSDVACMDKVLGGY